MKKIEITQGTLITIILLPILFFLVLSYGQRWQWQREVSELRESLEDEMAIKTVSGVEWALGHYPGKDAAREICSLSDKGEMVKSRHGYGLVICGDPDGRSAKIYGYDLDGKLVTIVTLPYGKTGPLADPERDPNSPNFTHYEIVRKKK